MVKPQINNIPRIEALLKSVEDSPYVLVEALAGFGKTTQCYAWAERLKNNLSYDVYWITRDRHTEIPDLLSKFVPRKDKKYWVFIDDFQHLYPDTQITLLNEIQLAGPQLRLVIIRRPSKDVMNFASLRVNGSMAYIGNEDLSWTQDEIKKYLKSSKSVASSIFDITLGWPASLPLFKVHGIDGLSRPSDISDIDLELFWSLLKEEVLDGSDFKDWGLIYKLSIMDEFQFEDAMKLLSKSSDELMVIIRALSAYWVGSPKAGGLHSSIRYVLSAMGWEHSPKIMEASHLQFSEYYWAKGDLVRALTHASKSGKTSYVCELIEQAGGLYLWLNEGLERIREVMTFTDDRLIASYPRLLLIKALLHVKEGRLSEANKVWNFAREQSNGFNKAREDGDLTALKNESALMGSLLAGYGCHSLDEQVELAQPSLLDADMSNSSDAQRGYVHTLICLHNLQNGNFEKVREHATLSETAFEKVGSDYGILYLKFHRSGAAYAQGDADGVNRMLEQAEKKRRKYFSEDAGLKLINNIFAAEIDFELGSFLSAKRKLSGLKRKLDESEAWFDVYAAAIKTHCYLSYLEKGYEQAVSDTYELGVIAKTKGLKRVERFADVLRLELACRSQDEQERDRLSDKLNLEDTLNDPQVWQYVMWREYVNMIVAQTSCLRQTGRLEQAVTHFKALYEFGVETENMICKLYGLSGLTIDDTPRSNELSIMMKSTGYILPMAMSAELQRASQQNHDLALIRSRTLDQIYQFQPKQGSHFTLREKEIIRQLSTGLSDKEIAIALDISVHTVRFHMKNIFSKTGKHDRHSVIASVGDTIFS